MKVLVMRKTTGFDIRGEYVRKKVAEGSLDRCHIDSLRQSHKEHYDTVDHLHKVLHSLKIGFTDVSQGRYWPEITDFDAVLAVGGDGTVLQASHHIDSDEIPVIGIRSSSTSVGHLCVCGSEEIDDLIKKLIANKIVFTKASRLRAAVKQIDMQVSFKSAPVLNDFLFCNENPAAVSKYRLKFEGNDVGQRSSGIWVATPAGSTAAIYAAGGEKMPLESKDFQFLVRELYRKDEQPFAIKRGLFNPDEATLEIQNLADHAILGLDGAHRVIRLNYGDSISFLRAPSLKMATKL